MSATLELTRSGRLDKVDWLILLACVALAAILRLDDVRQPLVDAFSWRQASTAMMADNFRLQSWNIFYPAVSWSGNDPGYTGREFQVVSYITAILHAIFGWHDWLGRLVAIFFGLWTVVALHRLVDCIWGTAHAHLAALAYAVMPGAILIDRSFLPEPAMLAFVTTGVWLLVRYFQEDRIRLLVLAGLFLTLGILAKLPGIAAGVSFAYVAGVWLLRGRLRQASGIIVTTIVALAAAVAYYAWAVYLGSTYPPYHVAGRGYIWDEGLQQFLSQRFYVRRAWEQFRDWFLSWPLIVITLIGLLQAPPVKGRPVDRALLWIPHVWLGAATLLYLAAAMEIKNNPWNHHMFNAPLAAFAGRGLFVIVSAGAAVNRSARLAMTLTVGRILIVVGFTIVMGTRPSVELMKRPYAGTALVLGQRLHELSAPGDLVIAVAPSAHGDPVAIYYSRRRGWVFPPAHYWHDPRPISDEQKSLAYLDELRGLGARWFGVSKDARDGAGRLFIEREASLLMHLDATAERVEDHPQYLIYRLPD